MGRPVGDALMAYASWTGGGPAGEFPDVTHARLIEEIAPCTGMIIAEVFTMLYVAVD
jgi:hypothetical protein